MIRALKILLAVMAAVAPAAAQETDPAPPPPAASGPATTPAGGAGDASSVVLAAKAPALPPLAHLQGDDESVRPVSAKIAADLASGMPKYSPPTPTPAVTGEPQDLRDVDKPKNEIRRLPAYIVRESRPAVFRNRDLYTTQGLVNLSFKSHPGLIFGNFLGLNSAAAYEMYLDDQRLENIQDLKDTAHAMSLGGDKAESEYILKASQDTYMRPIEETWNGPGGGGGFSGGGGR